MDEVSLGSSPVILVYGENTERQSTIIEGEYQQETTMRVRLYDLDEWLERMTQAEVTALQERLTERIRANNFKEKA
jgi:hypothetical protein